ncbi:MAG: SAF domain-containing protein, partial [Tomitella sp.]|nr:SAF domain-containing protein [Tomitella sp.]
MTEGIAMRGDTATITNGAPTAARRRGRPRRLSIGALLTVLGAVVGVIVFQQVGDRVPAIGIARTVPFGQQITEADLRQILLPTGSELALVEWTRSDEIVGRFAVTDLLPGQIMTRDAVTADRLP